MKKFVLILAIFISAGCVSQTSLINESSSLPQPTLAIVNSNSVEKHQDSDYKYEYDKLLLNKLNTENGRFRQVPNEFKSADFKNFTYDFGRMIDGEFEKEFTGKNASGGQFAAFEDVFYIDLIDDAKKEAIVFINFFSCGGSCDGGADIVYFYSSQSGKPRLIDDFTFGANAGGCSLKSLTIKDKKISIEQFGSCLKETYLDTDRLGDTSKGEMFFKYDVRNETHSVYSISKNGLKRESIILLKTEKINVEDSPAFISINE